MGFPGTSPWEVMGHSGGQRAGVPWALLKQSQAVEKAMCCLLILNRFLRLRLR